MSEYHRAMPQDIDSERGLLAAYVMDAFNVGSLCSERGLEASFFHNPAHALTYDALGGMWASNRPVDSITLTAELRRLGTLDQVGGPSFVSGLQFLLPTSALAGHYIDTLAEKRELRRIIEVGTAFAGRGYDETEDTTALLDQFEREATSIRKSGIGTTIHDPRKLAMDSVVAIRSLYERRGEIDGLSTGITALDRITDGLHGSELIIIAARPSMGKTALAMNIAEHIAADLGRPVGIFSLEMSAQQLMQRMLCGRAKVDLARVRDGMLADRDFNNITAAASTLATAKLHIDDTSSLSIQDMRSRARKMKMKYGIEAIFVDYLQLMRSTTKRGSADKRIEVGEISNGLKAMAKELNVPVVVLAQLNRNSEKRTGNRPMLSDLAESGSIEQDADCVALLLREEYYTEGEDAKAEAAGKATLIIAKQRNGPVGDVPLTFIKELTRFKDRSYSDYAQ